MCHINSGIQSAQIEKFMEYGMPQKIVKTVKYALRKRAEQHKTEHEPADPSKALDVDILGQDITPCKCTGNLKDIVFNEKPAITENQRQFEIPKLCGRFRKLQDNSKSVNDVSNVGSFNGRTMTNEKIYVDALAMSTHITKQFAKRLNCIVQKIQNNKMYTILTKTTQPAHLIAICILSFVLLTLWPNLFDSNGTKSDENSGRKGNLLAVVAYLGAFATHFGAQIWMTFVSGLSLYFSLPRHIFGQCQQILFPKYFALNSLLSISMLILFVKFFLSNWNVSECVQLVALTITAIIEVTVRLYLAPPMLRLMHEKYKIEDAIGSGKEVGSLEQGDLVDCPHYQHIHKAFRRIHMTVAIGNIVVLLTTCLHLYFLASKIQIAG